MQVLSAEFSRLNVHDNNLEGVYTFVVCAIKKARPNAIASSLGYGSPAEIPAAGNRTTGAAFKGEDA